MLKVQKYFILNFLISVCFSQIFFSEYAEGSSNNKYLEIYNGTDQVLDLSGYAYPSTANAPTVPGEYEYWNTFNDDASLSPGDVYVICHGSADDFIQAECDQTHTYLSNGDDGYCLVEGSEESFTILDCIGTWDADPGDGWDVAGVSNGTQDHTLVRKSTVLSGNYGDWITSSGTNESDSEWLVYDQNTWDYLGYHTTDSSGDIYGCMDENACNYNSDATVDNGTCSYESELFDCDGNCLNYIDECGVCEGDGTSCVGANIFISEYSEGSSYNKYIEIYNGTGQDLDLNSYELWKIANGGAWPEYTLALSATVLANDVYIVCAATADPIILAECDETWGSANFNGDDAMGLAFNNELIDQVGEAGDDPGTAWEVAGVPNATQNHTLVRNTNILVGNTNWSLSAGTSVSDSEWTVFDQNTWDYLGSHPHDFGDISGCMDSDAANYNPNATSDDGSCEYAQSVTIQDIQGTGDVSPILGQIVQTSGIVTGVSYSGFFIQDGIGPWSGLWIYISSPSVQVGDEVQVLGEVEEYNGLTEIEASNVSITSTGNPLPETTSISTGDLSEQYESVRVELSGTCIDSPNEYGEWTVDDGSGSTVVDDRLSESEIQINEGFIYDIIGVVDCYNDFKVQATQINYEEGQNIPPTAVAGDDISIDYGLVVTLDGTGSYDSDGSIDGYFWTQESGTPVFFGEPEASMISFVAPNEFTTIVFSLEVTDDQGSTSVDYINITVGEAGEIEISDIINNCSFDAGETISCDGQYNLSASSASECPLYEQSLTTTGVIIDYFDITPFNGPYSFTIQDTDGNQIDFVVWPESSSYQDGFDITATDLNILTQEPFGMYEVQITGELGAYCDDDEQLDIYSEWQITVEYESDITILDDEGENCVSDGDVNQDGIVNVIDIVQTVNVILDVTVELTDEELCAMDLNSDSLINVIDIVSLVNIILNN